MQRAPAPNLILSVLLLLVLLLAPLLAIRPEAFSGCQDLLRQAAVASEGSQPYGYAALSACLPWRGDLWEEAAHAALQAGDAKTAQRYLEAVQLRRTQLGLLQDKALSLQGLADLGEAYQALGDYADALQIQLTIADRTGLDTRQAQQIDRLSLAVGDYAGATSIWEKLAVQEPDNAEAQYRYGLLLAAQDPEASLTALEEASHLDASYEKDVSTIRQAILAARLVDDPAYALLAAGRGLAQIGRWELAAEAFWQAALQAPDYAEAWAFLGEARQHLPLAPDPAAPEPDGLTDLQTALALDPTSLSARLFLSLYWMRQGDFERALQAIDQALALSPDNPVLTAGLAGLQAASGDLYKALASYQKAAALAPFDPEYQRNIVRFSLEYNFQIEPVALPLARQLVSANPADAIDLDLMAQVLISRGDLASAERFLGRALRADSRSATAHLHLGLVYLLQGKAQPAAEELSLARSLDPGGPVDQQAQRLLNQ
jgi:tetratricopeptide (TPR) repeat protein